MTTRRGAVSQVLVFGLMALVPSLAQAEIITEGFTFAVASDGSNQSVGTHFHSNTGGAFGNPAGKAEVGNFGTEEVRGLSEYNLAGLAAGPAFVTFNVFKLGGLFAGVNDRPFTGNIDIVAFQGNNKEDISDYQAPSIGSVGTFSTSGLAVGNILSFDITSIYNTALTNGFNSLGIRLEISPGTNPQGGAVTFDNFRLTSNNETNVVPGVPEPGGLTMAGIGALSLAGYHCSCRLRRKPAA